MWLQGGQQKHKSWQVNGHQSLKAVLNIFERFLQLATNHTEIKDFSFSVGFFPKGHVSFSLAVDKQ